MSERQPSARPLAVKIPRPKREPTAVFTRDGQPHAISLQSLMYIPRSDTGTETMKEIQVSCFVASAIYSDPDVELCAINTERTATEYLSISGRQSSHERARPRGIQGLY